MGNWNVDIAQDLSDYLHDLEERSFAFDGGISNLNFAEAALVIQGSAAVYSKKVEYLHALAFKALDTVEEKKRLEAAVIAGENVDGDNEEDEMAAFLALDSALDDQLAPDSEINLVEHSFSSEDDPLSGESPTSTLAHSILMRLVTGKDVGDDEGMKITQCRVHSTGALVLDPNDYDALDDDLEFRAADARRENETRNPGAEARTIANETEEDAGAKCAMDAAVDDALGAAPMNDDDGDFGGTRDFDVDGDDARDPGAGTGRENAFPRNITAADAEDGDEEDLFDPYAPLDMHDPGVLPVRPLRRGRPGGEKTLRRRKRAAEAAAAAAADAATVLDESPESLEALTLSYLAAAAGGVGAAGPKAEFAYALTRLEMTRRALRQKTRRKGKQTVTATGDLLGLAASAAAEAVGGEEYDDEADDDGWGGGFADEYDDDAGGYEDVDDDDNRQLAGLVAAGGTRALADAEPEEMTYEELCQAHINNFLEAAAATLEQSDLAARVATWKENVDPSVAEQDAREVFDIHEYGDRVIDGLATAVESTLAITRSDEKTAPEEFEVGFEAVVAGQEKWQVARMFASMLQLINNGNVSVSQETAAALPISEETLALPAPETKRRWTRKKGDVEAAERPVEGAAYSTVDVGQLKLRLLTSDVRKLNITATRHVPEEIPMPILALPSSHGPDGEEKGTRVEESEEEVKPPPERRATTEAAATSKPNAVKEPEERKPQAKRQKATTSKKGSEHPAVARTTRSTRRSALAQKN